MTDRDFSIAGQIAVAVVVGAYLLGSFMVASRTPATTECVEVVR